MIGAVWSEGKSRSSASWTTRAEWSVGSTDASTPVNWTRVNGIPIAISSTAAPIAIGAARRITSRDSRYQPPAPVAARARPTRSELIRGPSAASSAGSRISDTAAAISATSMPPMPIENRNRCGKTISDASAAATVTALNRTVRPAVTIVVRSATAVLSPWRSISSRKREMMNSE